MRNFKQFTLITVIQFLLFSCLFGQSDLTQQIPIDKNIRIGKLDNGLTYYIRYNKKPEKRAELRLALNAGAILENEDQLGLAHFIEHMCFNGTEHFEKNELLHYLQSVGVKFGPDINGYTSFDETVYMLTVPTDSADVFDNAMLIMSDWAGAVSFDHNEIDKERGVVIEEWRLGRGAQQRMRDEWLPVVFHDSRYAERLPIGKKDIIENASYETIKQFYKDWYRPDLMAFIVVGDVDVDKVEKQIKEKFSSLKPVEAPRERELYDVPEHNETLVSVVSDKENPYTNIFMVYKHTAEQKGNLEDLRESIKAQLFTGMINQRLDELKEKENPPFLASYTYLGQLWARTTKAFLFEAYVQEDKIERGVKTLTEIAKQAKEYGFSETELERFKKTYLKGLETRYNEREKTESSQFASAYIDNFLKDKPVPGIEYFFEFAKNNIESITVDELNELAINIISDDNKVVVVQGIDKEGVNLPSKEDILSYVEQSENSDIKAYEDKVVSDKLISDLPAKGKIVKEELNEDIGVTTLTLSNGATVKLKPTDFKNDEILFEAYSKGGQSLYPIEDDYNAKYAAEIIDESGIGGYSNSDLKKILAGKVVSLTPYIGMEHEGFKGNCSPEDMKEFFELLHLSFTQPNINNETYSSYISRQKALASNLMNHPVYYFYEQAAKITSDNHPRVEAIPKPEKFGKVSKERALEIFKERFSDASDFTFTFVGAFTLEDIKPFIEQYIAALPSKNTKESYKDLGVRAPKGKINEKVFKGTDPKSFVILYSEKAVEFDQDDAHLLWTLGEYLNLRYIDILREELSGVYGFGVNCSLSQIPWERSELQIVIPCSPDNVDTLAQTAINEIKALQENGVNEEYLAKLINTQKRNKERELIENGTWLYHLVEIDKNNLNYDRVYNWQKQIDLVTSDNLKRVANEYLDLDNIIKVALYPENE